LGKLTTESTESTELTQAQAPTSNVAVKSKNIFELDGVSSEAQAPLCNSVLSVVEKDPRMHDEHKEKRSNTSL
jgi:hypothetical protein